MTGRAPAMNGVRLFGVGALFFAAFFAACSCPGPPCLLPLVGVDAGVFTANSKGTVSFNQALPRGCEDELAEAVTAALFDESNAPVPTVATFTQPENADAINVSVEFETRAPGWYHLSTLIEPGIANVQAELLVARVAAGEAVTVSSSCSEVHLTSLGTAVCDGKLFRDAGTAPVNGTFAATRVDVRADVIWAWSSTTGSLQRWKDSAAALAPEPNATIAQSAKPTLLLSSEDGTEAFIATNAEVSRFAYRNNTLVLLARNPLGTVLKPTAAFASKDTLFLFETSVLPSVQGKVPACGYSLSNDQVTKLPDCQQLVGVPMGIADGAFWFRDEASLRAYQVQQGELRVSKTLRLPSIGLRSIGDTPPGTPLVQAWPGGEWLAARLVSGAAIFDLYRTSTPSRGGGSATAVFLVDGSTTRVFPR